MATLLPQLQRLEAQVVAERNYDEAAKINSVAQELRSMLEAQPELNQRMDCHGMVQMLQLLWWC